MSMSKPPYAAKFRQQLVELALAGRGLKQLSREFGVSANTFRLWRDQARADAGGSAPAFATETPLSSGERAELLELRRKLRQVQQKRDILAKATAWFAGRSERTFTTSSNS